MLVSDVSTAAMLCRAWTRHVAVPWDVHDLHDLITIACPGADALPIACALIRERWLHVTWPVNAMPYFTALESPERKRALLRYGQEFEFANRFRNWSTT